MARTPKDAIVLCLDVGPGMMQAPPGANTPLDESIKVISLMVQRKVFSESKDEVALVLFGTEETLNNLDDSEGYQNVTVHHPLCIPGFDLLDSVEKIKPGSNETDFLDAITVGLDILHTQTEGKNIEYRRLVLFTNFYHPYSDDNIQGIITGFCDEGIQLNVISPGFDGSLPSDGDEFNSGSDGEGPSVKRPRQDRRQRLSEKPKSPQQRAGEKMITHIFSEGVDGCVYSYEQAVLALTGFEKKSVRSAAWKCNLELGADLTIRCAAYAKTKASSLKKTWSKVYAKTGKADDMMQQKYYVLQNDQQEEVDKDKVSKGYKYGKDFIPFSKDDEEQMKYQTDCKCLSILGFTNLSNILVQDLMDDQAQYVVAEKDDKAAEAAHAALVTALDKQKMCAVARHVYRKGSNPKLVALLPRVKGTYRCLIMLGLPFAEDLRSLDFPILESSKTPAPSQEQLSAMECLIDAMDLCKGDVELYHPKDTLNPYYQLVYHNLSHRALNPRDTMPPLDQRIVDILAPKEEIIEESRIAAEEVKRCFVLEEQEEKLKKASGKDTWADLTTENANKEADHLAEGDALLGAQSMSQVLGSSLVTSVGSVTPEQDFIALLKNVNDADGIKRVFEQLQQRVVEFVIDTFNPVSSKRVLPCLSVMRDQAIAKNQTGLFNTFLRQLKAKLLADKVKRKHWEEIVAAKMSLIEDGDVNDDDVKEFLELSIISSDKGDDAQECQDGKDADDLLDEL